MKLTKTQGKELLNQHTGTGYVCIKTSDNTYTTFAINMGKDNQWHSGTDGKLLDIRMADIAREIQQEEVL